MRNVLLLLTVAVAAGLLIVLLKFGTIDPCGIVRAEVRQEAARQGDFGGLVAAALPDIVVDAILAQQYGTLTPGRCLSLALSGGPGQRPRPAPQNAAADVANYNGQWVADVPIQGNCPAAHMTLFVNGADVVGSVVNSSGTFPVTGRIDVAGSGNLQIVDFAGHIKFTNNRFAADYFNSCGERRVVGSKLMPGQPD